MNLILEAALSFQQFADENGWSFTFVGGLAVGVWGEPRTTRDFDACLFTDFGGEEPAIDSILSAFRPRTDDAVPFALRYRVLKIMASNGTPGDVALGALPFEEEMISRARMVNYAPGISLRMPTPEDLVVMKAFAGRARDWEDIKGVLARSGAKLDLDYIRTRLAPLLEALDNPEAMDTLEKLIVKSRKHSS